MITLNVNGKKGEFILNLPTSLNEISEEYIIKVTEHIVPDANYSVIGLVYYEKLSSILLAARKSTKKADISVVPIFVKSGHTDSEFIKQLNVKDKLVIAPSDIMLGYHLSTPHNTININNILDIMEGDEINYAKSFGYKDYCYFIEFKLIPNCNIHGSYLNSTINTTKNPFLTKISEYKEPKAINVLV